VGLIEVRRGKVVLIARHAPHCLGCHTMTAVAPRLTVLLLRPSESQIRCKFGFWILLTRKVMQCLSYS